MRILLLFTFILIGYSTQAQRPAYYFFGQDQFKGIDIYDVIQDSHNNYWFATGGGLYKYDGYIYSNIECPEMKSASVFGFTKDSKGTIYCHNLHHQIFRIQEGKMELYYELPKKQKSPDMTMVVDFDDNLIIQAAGLTIIPPGKTKVTEIKSNIEAFGTVSSIYLTPEGNTFGSSTLFPMIVVQNKGKIEYLDLRNEMGLKDFVSTSSIRWTNLNGRIIGIDVKTLDVYELNVAGKTIRHLKKLETGPAKHNLRIYTTENRLWLMGTSNGVFVYDFDLNPLYNGASIYNDHRISDVCTDHENNILLSTFDEGVIVIPSNSVHGIQLPNNERIARLAAFNNSILIGTSSGTILSYNKDHGIKTIETDEHKRSIESLHYWKQRNAIVHTIIGGIQVLDLTTKKKISHKAGSLKDAFFINHERAVFSLNHGVYENRFDTNGTDKVKCISRGRSYNVTVDRKTGTYYVGTSEGFKLVTKNGKETLLEIDGNAVLGITSVENKGRIYIGTRKHGILIFENDKMVDRIQFEESIRKLIVHKGKAYLLTRSGLFLGNLKDRKFQKLNKSTGLNCENIVDFCIVDDVIYLTNSESLQYISLEKLFISAKPIPIRFSNILVNGKAHKSKFLNHDQSDIRFEFEVKTLRYQDNVHYEYKLNGYDEEWQQLPYEINYIQFSALPPGDYTFIVKSVNGDQSSKTIEYSFSIDAPFYQKWWFYLTIFLISFLIIGGLYSLRIKQIRKKNKERLEKQRIQTDLLESELKALRSQMNPHFIFNSLNSIQDLILKEDTDASYDYIVLFADLVRSALNYSNKDFIPIDKELEFLNVYLSLEKLRFKEDFSYEIIYDGDDGLDVPSMLIQPFIENALLHGLLHKNGQKKLTITFEYSDYLKCIIEDNGIGRKKASEIGDRQGRKHESFALDAINKRLEIFNERQGQEIGKYTIEDAYPDQEETGTRVIIYLPFKHHF